MNMMIFFFFILFIFSLFYMYMFILFFKNKYMYFLEWEILFINTNSLEFVIYFDWLTFSFLSIVFFISSLVSLYSNEYMKKKKNQFIYLIFLFVMSMMFFIVSPNMMSILIGWDGLGLVSYILIIFFQSNKSKNSGMLTIMLNRIGDVLIILSSWILFSMGSLNFLYLYNFNLNIILIIICAMTKSAQMPFSPWLPSAMAAPTPVSSLVHSSTLVTAGVFLMIRFNNYFTYNEMYMKYIYVMGTLTMFFSGLAANYEWDLKKIIALSTLSQLGLMMMILSLNFYKLSFFHLITHALFKALLFLCAGIIIHNVKNNQDIRYLNSLINFLPFTIMCFNMANLSLCGFPFLSGFFSKDLIIETNMNFNKNFLNYFILLISTSLTMSYTLRLTYFMSSKTQYYTFLNISENKTFSLVLFFMTFYSIFSGSIFYLCFYMNFFETYVKTFNKFIIPFILILGFLMSLNFKKNNQYFFSLWYLNYIMVYFKKVPYFFTEKIMFSSNFGFFEFLGNYGMMNLFKKLSKLNNKLLFNFKMMIFLSIFIYMINF